MLLGLLPLGTNFPLPNTPAGALVLTWAVTALVAVLMMINSSELAATTNSSVWAALSAIFSGLPATGIRFVVSECHSRNSARRSHGRERWRRRRCYCPPRQLRMGTLRQGRR